MQMPLQHSALDVQANGRECQCCGRFQSFDPIHGHTGPWIQEGDALIQFQQNEHGHRI
jgi:hypothetical protein